MPIMVSQCQRTRLSGDVAPHQRISRSGALISLAAPTAELAGLTDGHMSGQPFGARPGRFAATGLLPRVTAVRITAAVARPMTAEQRGDTGRSIDLRSKESWTGVTTRPVEMRIRSCFSQ